MPDDIAAGGVGLSVRGEGGGSAFDFDVAESQRLEHFSGGSGIVL